MVNKTRRVSFKNKKVIIILVILLAIIIIVSAIIIYLQKANILTGNVIESVFKSDDFEPLRLTTGGGGSTPQACPHQQTIRGYYYQCVDRDWQGNAYCDGEVVSQNIYTCTDNQYPDCCKTEVPCLSGQTRCSDGSCSTSCGGGGGTNPQPTQECPINTITTEGDIYRCIRTNMASSCRGSGLVSYFCDPLKYPNEPVCCPILLPTNPQPTPRIECHGSKTIEDITYTTLRCARATATSCRTWEEPVSGAKCEPETRLCCGIRGTETANPPPPPESFCPKGFTKSSSGTCEQECTSDSECINTYKSGHNDQEPNMETDSVYCVNKNSKNICMKKENVICDKRISGEGTIMNGELFNNLKYSFICAANRRHNPQSNCNSHGRQGYEYISDIKCDGITIPIFGTRLSRKVCCANKLTN